MRSLKWNHVSTYTQVIKMSENHSTNGKLPNMRSLRWNHVLTYIDDIKRLRTFVPMIQLVYLTTISKNFSGWKFNPDCID